MGVMLVNSHRIMRGVYEQVGDWDAVVWCSLGISSIVILLEDDTVFGDIGEGDVGVGYCVYQAGGTHVGLDANTIGTLDDSGVRNDNVLNCVIRSATN